MSYLDFHLIFTIPLFFIIGFINKNNPMAFGKKSLQATSLLCLLALLYTTPWDSYLIKENIWSYSPNRVLGTLFYIPFEEYFFFFIQTIIGCLFTSFIYWKFSAKEKQKLDVSPIQWISVACLWPILIFTLFTLQPENQNRYLWLVFFWAIPVLIMQWSVGYKILFKEKFTWIFTVSALCSYFWLADSLAISKEIWTFPENTISGLKLFNILPIEEALFFLVTNLMVVQGYILFTTVDFKNSNLWRLKNNV